MNNLSNEQKQLVFDYCIGVTDENESATAQELIFSNEEAAALHREIQTSLSDDFIQELIVKIVKALPKEKEAGIEISLSAQDKKRLESVILSGLKKEFAQGITFKVNPNINKGLYIGIKGEDFHYDFTDQAILDILKEYLRPFITNILNKK